MKKTTTRQNIKSKDTKKNKGLNEKEKSKKEEKIDPNWFGDEISSKTQDLLSVITNRAMSWLFTSRWYQIKTDMNLKTDLVKGRRENVFHRQEKVAY